MVKESVTNAIQDTKGKVSFSDFQQAVVAYVDGIVYKAWMYYVIKIQLKCIVLQVNLAVAKEHFTHWE